jgi:hypothetical protein
MIDRKIGRLRGAGHHYKRQRNGQAKGAHRIDPVKSDGAHSFRDSS